jgi:exonuclease SbcD
MIVSAFSDCHIGSYAKKLNQETGLNSRFLDMLDSLRFVAEDCKRRRVDAALFGGDLYRNHKPTPTESIAAHRLMRYLAERMPLVMIDGNHDLPRGANESSAVELVAASMPTFGYSPAPKQYAIGAGGGFQLFTLPFPNRSQLAAKLPGYANLSPEETDQVMTAHLSAILQGFRANIDPSKPSILLAHISVDCAETGEERSIMAGRDITIPLSAIPEEFTFVALGHVHKAQDFGAYGRPNVFYCGSTDRISFGEEEEQKSYVVVDTVSKTWERVPIPCREYQTFDVRTIDRDYHWPSLETAKDAICRVKIQRQENDKPDYEAIRTAIEDAGAFDFRGFVEDVQRVASVRSEEIVHAQTLEELLRIWAESKNCDVPIDELSHAAGEMEREVA